MYSMIRSVKICHLKPSIQLNFFSILALVKKGTTIVIQANILISPSLTLVIAKDLLFHFMNTCKIFHRSPVDTLHSTAQFLNAVTALQLQLQLSPHIAQHSSWEPLHLISWNFPRQIQSSLLQLFLPFVILYQSQWNSLLPSLPHSAGRLVHSFSLSFFLSLLPSHSFLFTLFLSFPLATET